jgi:hypothetical protein
MKFKTLLLLASFVFLLFFSCAEDTDITVPRNLQEYITVNSNRDLDTVIACAASASGSTSLSYIFYYPVDGATDIRYYETETTAVDENDFSNYRRKNLATDAIFGEKLKRFSRSDTQDSWCIVTYLTNGKLHKSDPIHLKIASKQTVWSNSVTIEYTETTKPKFTWTDNNTTENVIYFQVISDEENTDGEEEFISGTYTQEKTFQFYDTSNVVLDINEGEAPSDLVEDEEYIFSMMGVSQDNWVNLFIQKSFVPRNLEEYIASNATSSLNEITAFAASASGSTSFSYIYYYPITGATDIRYYETTGTALDENNYTNYRRIFLTDTAVYGGKLSRFSRLNSQESWCVVTYLVAGKLYTSKPIRLKNQTKSTEWLSDVTTTFLQTLVPQFTWADGTILDNTAYFQIVSDASDEFLSGTFTTDKMFQYNIDTNVTETINTETPPILVINDTYNITVMGLSDDNWVNLVHQTSFIVQ